MVFENQLPFPSSARRRGSRCANVLTSPGLRGPIFAMPLVCEELVAPHPLPSTSPLLSWWHISCAFVSWFHTRLPPAHQPKTGLRLKHVIGGLIEGSMRICLDGAETSPSASGSKINGGGGGASAVEMAGGGAVERRGEGTGFSLVLDEQWRGTGSTPSMKMV